MKGKKADAYRQSDTQQGQFPSAHRIPVPNKKIHILKEKQQRQISCNPCCQYPFCCPFSEFGFLATFSIFTVSRFHSGCSPAVPFPFSQLPRHSIIKCNAKQQKKYIFYPKTAIEPKRHDNQPEFGRHAAPAIPYKIKPCQANR